VYNNVQKKDTSFITLFIVKYINNINYLSDSRTVAFFGATAVIYFKGEVKLRTRFPLQGPLVTLVQPALKLNC
jgi:hypothetical protein